MHKSRSLVSASGGKKAYFCNCRCWHKVLEWNGPWRLSSGRLWITAGVRTLLLDTSKPRPGEAKRSVPSSHHESVEPSHTPCRRQRRAPGHLSLTERSGQTGLGELVFSTTSDLRGLHVQISKKPSQARGGFSLLSGSPHLPPQCGHLRSVWRSEPHVAHPSRVPCFRRALSPDSSTFQPAQSLRLREAERC